LRKLEPGFTAEQLGRSISLARMQDVAWSVQAYAQQNEKALKKKDKWDLPKKLIDDAVKKFNPGASIEDAWGTTFGVRERAKGESNQVGGAFFDAFNLVSAGPDGKFGTDDDVALDFNHDRWQLIQGWWLSDDARSRKQPQLAWRNNLQQNWHWRRNRMLGDEQ